MIIDIILFLLAFSGLIIATLSDLKTKEIPDSLNYSLIISALSLRFLYSSIYKNWDYFTFALINLAIFFLIANFMYYTKQWGGGDSKLLIAISVLFATYPKFLYFLKPKLFFSFPLTIFINILIIGALYTIIFSIFLSIKHRKTFSKQFKIILQKTKTTRRIILTLSILLLIFLIIIQDNLTKLIFFLTAVSILILIYFWIFVKSVENSCMYKLIQVSKLREGDWIIKDIKYKGKTIYKKSLLGITNKQISKLKKTNIKKVLIKEGIAFTPSFLLSSLISLIFGNIFLLII